MIETERLILTVPTSQDVEEMHICTKEVWGDLQHWMSWAADGFDNIDSTRYYIEVLVPEQIKMGGLPLIARCKLSNKLVVVTGLTKTDEMNQNQVSTGYWVTKNFLGKGYATEATVAAIVYAFNMMSISEVLISYYENNEKSKRIIDKLGFNVRWGLRP